MAVRGPDAPGGLQTVPRREELHGGAGQSGGNIKKPFKKIENKAF